MRRLIGFLAAAFLAWTGPAIAQTSDREVVTAFYTQLLNGNQAPDLTERAGRILAESWMTLGNNTGGDTRAQFLTRLPALGRAVPNLRWEIVEMLQQGNRFIVRGRATGTPAGAFLGVEGGGRGFDIMSIDIHTVENGRITRSYHTEDWAGAIRQLRGQ